MQKGRFGMHSSSKMVQNVYKDEDIGSQRKKIKPKVENVQVLEVFWGPKLLVHSENCKHEQPSDMMSSPVHQRSQVRLKRGEKS